MTVTASIIPRTSTRNPTHFPLFEQVINEIGNFLSICREDTPGKPILYGVTDEFMDAFSLTSLDELPELKEMKEDFDQDDIFNTKYTESMEEGEQ